MAARKASSNKTKSKIIHDPYKISEKVSYPFMFSDSAVRGVLMTFQERYVHATGEAREFIYREAGTTAFMYILLVYDIYPRYPKFKKIIDTDSELSRNFAFVKEWLDLNNGQQIYSQMLSEFESKLESKS